MLANLVAHPASPPPGRATRRGRDTRQAALAFTLILLLVACTSARVVKSDVAQDLLALALRADEVAAEYRAAWTAKTLSRPQAEAWNAYLVGFKRAYRGLTDRFQVVTTETLPEVKAQVAALRADLEKQAATLRAIQKSTATSWQ